MDGLAFRLSPDPSFYFDSHGHHRALAALRRGLSEASGFTVFSGEIGAGKTTVVRAVLGQLKPGFFAVAQIVSTQLDATELLRAVSIGFGLPWAGEDSMALTAVLRRFLVDLAAKGRRAILVVDEAHNLHPDAFDQLAALAMRGAPRGRGMQICLVGQPQLQQMLDTGDLLAVREQVCVSCHLGPIERDEVRPYVEHRLRKVGWKGRPAFDAAAFEEIYRWTEGIPRRINSLCGRLIAACPAGREMTIAAPLVALTARQQRTEVGDAVIEPPVLPAAPVARVVPITRPKPGPVLCLVAQFGDYVRAAALMSAMSQRPAAPMMKLVRVDSGDALALSAELFDGLLTPATLIDLGCAEESREFHPAALKKKFELVLAQAAPRALLAFSRGDLVIACTAVARAMRVPIVRFGSVALDGAGSAAAPDGPGAAEAMPDLWYANDERSRRDIESDGMPPAGIHCAGDLLIDAVQTSLGSRRKARLGGARHRLVIPIAEDGARYGLVLIEDPEPIRDRQTLVALLAFLRRIGASMPLVLLMRSEVEREFDLHGLQNATLGDRLFRLRAQAYGNQIELLRSAACVMTDSTDVQQEAAVLRVPCLALFHRSASVPEPAAGSKTSTHSPAATASVRWAVRRSPTDDPTEDGKTGFPDGLAGDRIAEHLCAWLETVRLVTEGNCQQVLTSARLTPS